RDVKDPEFGQSIIDRDLIDEVRFKDGVASITYHLTVPFCPMPFALFIGRQIRRKAKEVTGVEKVKVTVKDHIQAEIINKVLEKEE
ncbi:MAG: iron-sulfur cluster assembly protein, partial [Candidatus Methanomethylicia archaeon]